MKEAYVLVHRVVVRCRQGEDAEPPTERVYVAAVPGHWAGDAERVRRIGQIVGNHLTRQTAEGLTHAVPTRWGLAPSGSPGDCENGGCMLRIGEDGGCSEFAAPQPAGA